MELFSALFPAKVDFKPPPSTGLWCYTDGDQRIAKRSAISSPLRNSEMPLEAVLATPRKLTSLAASLRFKARH